MAGNRKTKDAGRETHSVPAGDARIGEDLKTWHCVAVLAAMVAVFFRDQLLGNAWLWEDFLYFSYPVRSFAATSMAMGQMPLWNPYTFNGMPFLADIQTTVFYLPLTALALAVRDGALGFYWLELVVIAHYILAGVSMFLLALSFGLKRLPSLFAGATYMLSGFMITHAIHQQIITLVAWYPLAFLLFRKVLSTGEWRWVFLCALVIGHSTLAGYPQLSLYLYFFLFLYFAFESFTSYKGGALFSTPALKLYTRVAAVILLSLSLAMIQLLPTFELADLSQRAQITYEKATEGSLAWSQFLTLIYPKFFGSAGANGYNYWGPGTYWYYWETCIYIGVLPLLLMGVSAFAIRKNKSVAFFWGVAIFVLMFALGNNFLMHKLFFDFVPGFATFRNPARMGIWFSFAAALLSAFALQTLLSTELTKRDRTNLIRVLLSVAGIGILLWGLTLSGTLSDTFSFMKNPHALQVVKKELNISLSLLVVSVGAIWMIAARRIWLRLAGPALLVLFFLDMVQFGGDQNSAKVDPSLYFKRAGNAVQFLKNEGKTEIFRVNTRNSQGMVMDRNQGMVDRIYTMEGYTPLVLQRVYAPYGTSDQTYDLLNVKYRTVTDQKTGNLSLVDHPSYFQRAFFLYDVHVVHGDAELAAYFKNPEFNHRVTAVLEEDPGIALAAPSHLPTWNAHITSYENNRISLDVKTSQDGLLVLSEIYYPGWKAYIDNHEATVLRADYNLRSVVVKSGVHKVVFSFEPVSYARGKMVTLASLLLCGVGVFVSQSRTRRRSFSNPPIEETGR